MEHFKKLIKNKAMHEAILFLMMSIGLLIHALTKHYAQSMPDWKMSPYLFPLLVSFFLFLLSISMLADARRTLKISEEEKQDKVSPQPIYWKKNTDGYHFEHRILYDHASDNFYSLHNSFPCAYVLIFGGKTSLYH